MEKIKSFIWLVAAILIYTMVFNWVNPMSLFSLTQGVVDASKVEKHPDENYIGYKAGGDIPRVQSKEDLEETEGYITIDATHAIPLNFYKIKNKEDMEDLKDSRNSKGRKVHNANKDIPEYTNSPSSFKGFYNPYYLVGLEDDTYVVTYLDESYGEKIQNGKQLTLPIGKMIDMTSQVRGEIAEIKDTYNVNEEEILCCFNDEAFIKHEQIELYIRGGISIIVIVIIYMIICKLFPKCKISFE